MKNIAPIRSPDEPVRMPRSLKQFLRSFTQQHPSNLILFNIAFTPMEPDEWCLIWIPRIYPDIQAPLPGEKNRSVI